MKLVIMFFAILFAGLSHAQLDQTDEQLITIAKGNYAAYANKPLDQMLFGGMKLSSDRTLVCGAANGTRFVVPPRAGDKPVAVDNDPDKRSSFGYLWDLRCDNLSTDKAVKRLQASLRENICTIDNWDWGLPTPTSMRIMGTASCSSGILRITAFDNGKEVGTTDAKIVDRKFTADYAAAPPSGAKASIKIKYLSASAEK